MRRCVPLIALFVVALTAATLPSTTLAQPSDPPAPKSTAEVLFDEGLSNMQAGRHETGCPALAESYRLEPLPGVLFTLAACHHQWGKLASALSQYRDYLSQVTRMAADTRLRQGERPKVAEEAVAELEPLVPRLTISLAEGVPDTATVKRGDALVPPTQLGRAIPLDPGSHDVTLDVPGEVLSHHTITLAPGDAKRIVLSLPARPKPPPTPAPNEQQDDTMRTSAYVVGGVGITGVIVGVVAGAIAINRHEEIEENCVDLVCNATGISKVETVREAGNTATVALVIGGVALAAGITLWFLSEPDERSAKSAWLVTNEGIGFRW